jgi:FkbM family methyltransferase
MHRNTAYRENRNIGQQIKIVAAIFRQNNPLTALTLIRPVLTRRISEVLQTATNPLKFFSEPQKLIRDFIRRELSESSGSPPDSVGNYAAIASLLSPESIVYSFGVGGNIEFDIDLTAQSSCAVYLFDPTPRSIRFMEQYRENPLLQFRPWGVWTSDGLQRFFSSLTLAVNTCGNVFQDFRSGSIENALDVSTWFEGECHTLPTIMNKLGHDRIDLLKMDIEGAALDVLEHLLDSEIRPKQLVVEFEAPRISSRVKPFFWRLEKMIKRLRHDGYTLHNLCRGGFYIDSIEILAVRL